MGGANFERLFWNCDCKWCFAGLNLIEGCHNRLVAVVKLLEYICGGDCDYAGNGKEREREDSVEKKGRRGRRGGASVENEGEREKKEQGQNGEEEKNGFFIGQVSNGWLTQTQVRLSLALPSTKDVVARYNSHVENVKKLDPQFLELQHDRIKMGKELADKSCELRQLNGEDLEGLNMDELQKLENEIEAGLSRVLQAKEENIMNEILALEEKGAKLLEANYELRQTIGMLSNTNGSRAAVALESDISTAEEGSSSESDTNVSSCYATGSSADDDDSSDTLSLKLGLPYRG